MVISANEHAAVFLVPNAVHGFRLDGSFPELLLPPRHDVLRDWNLDLETELCPGF